MPTDNNANLSIGEVARLTGVNPVTLRAWQRRFGLVIPQRTPKGHRLYSQEQVQQIREILSCLSRAWPSARSSHCSVARQKNSCSKKMKTTTG